MRYAEALRARELPTRRREPVRLVANVETGQLETFLVAHGAREEIGYEIEATPFGGLRAGLERPPGPGQAAVVLVTFEDAFPELGYRAVELWTTAGVEACLAEAPARIGGFVEWLAGALSRWPGGAVVVPPLAAPPPLLLPAGGRAGGLRVAALWLEAELVEGLAELPRVVVLDADPLRRGLAGEDGQSAAAWLQAGTPLGLVAGDRVAAAVHRRLAARPAAKKVLVTDADHTLWQGVLGDDGPGGLSAHPDGPGWVHHVYQGALSLLRSRGAVLAICSRGEATVLAEFIADPLGRERVGVRLGAGEFAAVRCSWGRKSAMLRELAVELGLGLDSFVFVDDNRVELAEVGAALPQVTTLRFPRASELDGFLGTLAELFATGPQSAEDRRRSDLYEIRRQAEVERPDFVTVETFLAHLEMVGEFEFVTDPDDTRPLQLLNKTNQFNLTGERFGEGEWGALLADPGRRCVRGRLRDRHGDHGVVLAAVLAPAGERVTIEALAMSCRVLERGFETAFLDWLAGAFPGARTIAVHPRDSGLNAIARDWLTRLGFAAAAEDGGGLELAAGAEGFALPRHQVALGRGEGDGDG